MTTPVSFIHLRLHTEYSIRDSVIRIPELITQAKSAGMPALALTDLSNLFGVVKFYKAALSAGIKPLIGADLYIENVKEPPRPFRLLLLCQNDTGYKNLIQLISRSYLENQHHGKAVVKMGWLSEYSDGLIALSGEMEGDIGQALLQSNLALAKECLTFWQTTFPGRFYIELQKVGRPQEEFYWHAAIPFASENQIPLVATQDVRFLKRDDFEAHEARVCIYEGWLLNDPKRPHRYTEQQYLRAAEEMQKLFKSVPEALQNTVEIAKRCNVTLPLDHVFLPKFPVPAGMTAEEFLKKTAQEGFEKKWAHILQPRLMSAQSIVSQELKTSSPMGDLQGGEWNSPPCIAAGEIQPSPAQRFSGAGAGVQITTEDYLREQCSKKLQVMTAPQSMLRAKIESFSAQKEIYQQRLDRELGVINQMGFAGYFLIVADFVKWSKDNDIPVGPGRGSGAGSLVAYSIDITGLDPLEYDLLFERFLNPERISMPDFDIDFCMIGRDRVIEYVSQKYGRDHVSQIITYGAMAAKAVVRDAGRVLGQGYGFVDRIAKLIPFEVGIHLKDAIEREAPLKQLYEEDAGAKEILDLAQQLEGLKRNVGKHAGGVVIAPSKLTDFTPLYCEESGENLVSQFDMGDVATVGLVKFDFLGLRTLTIIHDAVQMINAAKKLKGELPINIETIPMNDSSVFVLLKNCQTTAIFQLESRGMKDLVRRLQPDCFEDMIALVALFRPGPLQSGMVDDFIRRKHGQDKVEYPHPQLIPVLKPTYGVILYQEQVMQIAQVLAGYSLGGADLLRRAMGKKKAKEMAKQREVFTEGAKKNGIDPKTSTAIFDLMEKFADYGFNKSHSAAYALLSYQTAWLKVHYPVEFMAAVLSSDMDNTDKLVGFIEECRAMKIPMVLPNIHESEFAFMPKDEKIIYGLGAVKGLGQIASEMIAQERKANGPFKDLFDFCLRVDLRKVNKKVLEVLVKSGAMDVFGVDRASLWATLGTAVANAEKAQRDQADGQMDWLQFLEEPEVKKSSHLTYVAAKPWTDQERLQFEKETLGHYVSGHPLTLYQDEFQQLECVAISQIPSLLEKTVRVGGLVTDLRVTQTKRGDKMAFITLQDLTGTLELAAFSDVYLPFEGHLEKDQLLIIEGIAVSQEGRSGYRFNAKKLLTMDQAREAYSKYLLIFLDEKSAQPPVISQLADFLKQYRGGRCKVQIAYQKGNTKAWLPLGNDWTVSPTDPLLQGLRQTFPNLKAELIYSAQNGSL